MEAATHAQILFTATASGGGDFSHYPPAPERAKGAGKGVPLPGGDWPRGPGPNLKWHALAFLDRRTLQALRLVHREGNEDMTFRMVRAEFSHILANFGQAARDLDLQTIMMSCDLDVQTITTMGEALELDQPPRKKRRAGYTPTERVKALLLAMLRCDARFLATRTFFEEMEQHLSHRDIVAIVRWAWGAFRSQPGIPRANSTWFRNRLLYNSRWKYFNCSFASGRRLWDTSDGEEPSRLVMNMQSCCTCNWCCLGVEMRGGSRGVEMMATLPPLVQKRALKEKEIFKLINDPVQDMLGSRHRAEQIQGLCLEVFHVRMGHRD